MGGRHTSVNSPSCRALLEVIRQHSGGIRTKELVAEAFVSKTHGNSMLCQMRRKGLIGLVWRRKQRLWCLAEQEAALRQVYEYEAEELNREANRRRCMARRARISGLPYEEGDDEDDTPIVQRVVPAIECRVKISGPTSVWDLARM